MALSKAQMENRLHMLDLILEHDDLNGDLQLDVLTVLMSVAGQMELLSRSPLSGAGAAPRDTRSLENETSNQPRSDVGALRDNLRRLKVSWSGMPAANRMRALRRAARQASSLLDTAPSPAPGLAATA
jgi:hypothetical protein